MKVVVLEEENTYKHDGHGEHCKRRWKGSCLKKKKKKKKGLKSIKSIKS